MPRTVPSLLHTRLSITSSLPSSEFVYYLLSKHLNRAIITTGMVTMVAVMVTDENRSNRREIKANSFMGFYKG